MKKTIILILSVLFCVSCFAQKSYVHLIYSASNHSIKISGAIPSSVNSYYNIGDEYGGVTVGDVINYLAAERFVVEQIACPGTQSSYYYEVIIMSRNATSEDDAISIVRNDDCDVREVARYNLQGMQVNENEKGIQIIVYSNYTTKTVIVE